ncbi:MAG: hypothetical protein LKJ88_03145 [Bacilli bacterium]|jgi:hypothetical protein|nr:hypothetical protein [Bacilli bacterium]
MKTKRIIVALYVYEQLMLPDSKVTKENILSSLDISPATFKRVISDIRCYLQEYQPEKELVYIPKGRNYVIKRTKF